MQDKLGQQNFHDMKKLQEPLIDTLKNTSEKVTKTLTESSFKNNQAISNLNDKLLEILNDRGVIATHLLSRLSKVTNPENTSQFILVKDSNSNRVNDLLIHNSIPITLYDNLLTFRDTGKEFELKGELLKMITNKIHNVDLASLAKKKLMYDSAKEMSFDVKAQGNKSNRDRTLLKSLKSPGFMVSASDVSSSHENKFLENNIFTI